MNQPHDHSLPNDGEINTSVAVVVPTYNEAENLPELARRLFGLKLPGLQLVVVDDSSPDGTADVGRRLSEMYQGRVQVIQRPGKQGLGTAYLAGFDQALQDGADYIVQMDADLSHAPEEVPRLIHMLERYDVVVGSRYVNGGRVDEAWSTWRRLISYIANQGIRSITGLKIKDATSGFKACRASVIRSLTRSGLRCEGFGFQVELAHACQRMEYAIVEHPILFANRTRGRSKMSVNIVLEALRQLAFLRLRRTS
ncbi:polyprenol monophosphomannose synthase [Dehalococcoidia bacterium]|nr:polyprenol monophosphomannose synthase [Dehalococcoidia bacterium]